MVKVRNALRKEAVEEEGGNTQVLGDVRVRSRSGSLTFYAEDTLVLNIQKTTSWSSRVYTETFIRDIIFYPQQ